MNLDNSAKQPSEMLGAKVIPGKRLKDLGRIGIIYIGEGMALSKPALGCLATRSSLPLDLPVPLDPSCHWNQDV